MSGCVHPQFSRAVRDRYALSDLDLTRVQFFTSEQVVLQREVTQQAKASSGNALTIQSGLTVEEIVLPSGTPGVAVRVEGDFLLVSFSRGKIDESLWFAMPDATVKGRTPEQRVYQLSALENPPIGPAGQPFAPQFAPGFLVTWAGQKYRVAEGRTVSLLYEIDASFEAEKIKHKPTGWRLSDGPPPGVTPAGR